MLESDAGTAFRATVNIVVSEAKIAVRHPAILGAAVVSAGLMMVDLLSGAAVMQTLSVSAGAWLLTLAAAAFLVGSWHSSSETRYSTEEHLDSLPYGRVVRTVGLLGGCLGPAAIGVALISIYLMASQAMNPAGEVMPAELVTSILAIVVAWFAGVLVRGGKRVRRAPALILIVYATPQLLGSPDVEIGASPGASGSRARGLLLWMPSSAFDTPFDALIRPSMPRAFYLLALASLFLAILIVEARGSIEFRGVTAIAIAGMLVFAAATSVMSFTPSQEWAYPAVSGPSVDWTKLIESQECTESQPSLCAPFPDSRPGLRHGRPFCPESDQSCRMRPARSYRGLRM